MGELRLHTDADASSKALHAALVKRGHDVTRTPTNWIAHDASDEQQLLGATAHGRSLFTFNVRDFLVLARQYLRHGGIIRLVPLGHVGQHVAHAVDSAPLPGRLRQHRRHRCSEPPCARG